MARNSWRADEEEGPDAASFARSRWATRRLTVRSGGIKRLSLLARKRGQRQSDEKAPVGGETAEDKQRVAEDGHDGQPRQLYFNQPLPKHLEDEDGSPINQYRRNKIRTARYTPLSFIPKNLWLQFHNVANIFFLFLVILAIFPIFGGVNPGLNAVPLIFIITVTGVKDAIEDSRRTQMDNDLNNAPVHRLKGWKNVNVREDNVSRWRRFKKATSRFSGSLWDAVEGVWKQDAVQARDSGRYEDARASLESRMTRHQAEEENVSPRPRQTLGPAQEEIQLTPVQSPLPRADRMEARLEADGSDGSDGSAAARQAAALRASRVNVINADIKPSGRAKFHKDAWKSLLIGDFVRLYSDDEMPADIVILSTSDPDGSCYVETKNLDGETNLKVRSALRCSRSVVHASDCERAQFVIESEAPQANLYKYSGAVKWEQRFEEEESGRAMSEPISIDNVLLRGCQLRNTDWVLGVVIFTGHDTKIMMNQGASPSKRPRIARELNFNVICNFGILLVMCLIAAIWNGVSWAGNGFSTFETPIAGSPGLIGFITFWAAVIVFQNLIPISLYISLEIVRLGQALWIYKDIGMYHEAIDQPCQPRSWNISDDLGQIEYIFSDKTGTLTQNVMEFKKASINGQPYGEAYTEAQAGMNKRLGVDVEEEGERVRAEIAEARLRTLDGLGRMHENPYLHEDDLTFVAPDFVDDLAGKNGQEQQQACERFMLALALCHSVLAEKKAGEKARMMFKAQSPDEAALVATARDMGFTVLGSSGDGFRLNVMGEERHYPLLNTLEFNSGRKRMSTIVRVHGKIVLFCKGADSVIYSRLRKGEQQQLRTETAKHLELFAVEGLRTLCIAQRELGEAEYAAWKQEHDLAATALEEREEKLEAVADKIEQQLTLLGGTAIEDRLQDGVPDSIELLGEAGIKLWVLTGDKVETAINIGFSCKLLNNEMDLIRMQVDEMEEGERTEEDYLARAEKELDRGLAMFQMQGSDEELARARREHEPPAPTHALVIDGFTLRWVLSDRLKQKLLLLCKQCKSVLCCRVSPAQKAAVVSMVKNGLNVMTLSIGDGANDVAMIQEADVGVGIAGEEGRQAVMSSDYAIGQFRFLQRLVLVHGRWSYRRLAETTSNFFYKNMVWTWSIFWYQIYCSFDISYVFDYIYILSFNLIFTSVPVVLMGILDQDVSDEVCLKVPQLYRRGIERLEWTQKKFWGYMVDGIYQSLVCFFIPAIFLCLAGSASGKGLFIAERYRLGAYIAHPAILAINLFILLNTYRWDWVIVLAVLVSDLCVFIVTLAFSETMASPQFHGTARQVYGEPTFWMCFIVTPIICVTPRLILKCTGVTFFPSDVDIIREQIYLGAFTDSKKDRTRPTSGAGLERASSRPSVVSPSKGKQAQSQSVDEDRRPIYPPSVATHNARSRNGSDRTNFTLREQPSLEAASREDERQQPAIEGPALRLRPSNDRARPSYDRIRMSMDRVRPSFEQTADFTSAARLSQIESSYNLPEGQRRFDLTAVRKRGLSVFSKKSMDP